MSVSKWRYTEECNGRPCPGDCDHCSFEPTDLISRADAIDAVKDIILKRFNLADWYEEMLNCGVEIEDIIKALPSAELPKGELISRADAVKAVIRMCAPICDNTDSVVAEINALPSADAVQGEWEHLSIKSISRSGVDELQELQCSNCGKWVTTPYMYYPSYHKFCPCCGAVMSNSNEGVDMKGGAE